MPNFVLIVNLYSPDGSIDPVTLSNYASLQLVDPLKRLAWRRHDADLRRAQVLDAPLARPRSARRRLGLTAVDVQQAIAEQNIQVAAGKLGQDPAPAGTQFQFQINALGRLSDPDQFGDIVVRAGFGSDATVRLRDVARIELQARCSMARLPSSTRSRRSSSPSDPAARLKRPRHGPDRQRRHDGDAEDLPRGIDYSIRYDTTMFVSASMHEVLVTFAIAILLVSGVVYMFLQSWRATIIPVIAIPVSLIGTLAVMLAVGFSINTVEPARRDPGRSAE